MSNHYLEALKKVQTQVEESFQAFRPVIGQRHACIGLYDEILKVEAAMYALKHKLLSEIEKEEG